MLSVNAVTAPSEQGAVTVPLYVPDLGPGRRPPVQASDRYIGSPWL
jgi:hypothetical protein